MMLEAFAARRAVRHFRPCHLVQVWRHPTTAVSRFDLTIHLCRSMRNETLNIYRRFLISQHSISLCITRQV